MIKNEIIHAAKNTKKLNIRNFEKTDLQTYAKSNYLLEQEVIKINNFMLWQLSLCNFSSKNCEF